MVAVRDSDYAAFTWFPALPELDEWLDLYQRVARGNGGEPDAGRRLLSWAHAAGFTDVTASSSTWCFADAEDRAWWGGMWADRVREVRHGAHGGGDRGRDAGGPGADLRRLAALGGPTRTAGCRSCTASWSAGSDPGRSSRT